MPPNLKRVSMDYIDRFSWISGSYNSVLGLGATGVDNGDDQKHGFEKINGGKNNLTFLLSICLIFCKIML